jgi:hypothetical protein
MGVAGLHSQTCMGTVQVPEGHRGLAPRLFIEIALAFWSPLPVVFLGRFWALLKADLLLSLPSQRFRCIKTYRIYSKYLTAAHILP